MYEKSVWHPGRAGNTIVSAAKLNNLETQYDDAVADIATQAISPSGEMTTGHAVIVLDASGLIDDIRFEATS